MGLTAQWLKAMEVFRFGIGLDLQGTNALIGGAPDFVGELLVDYELPVIISPNAYIAFRF